MMTPDIEELRDILAERLASKKLGGAGFSLTFDFGDLCLGVGARDLLGVVNLLKEDTALQFTTLIDICGVDWPERDDRFDVVYHLLSTELGHRLRLKVALADGDSIASIAQIYPAAVWYEREAWDMFGILFSDSPDPRRLLTDYGFNGHPLRKDFPLTGFVEVRYDNEQSRVVQEPVSLVQDFRSFDFTSPWEGMNEVVMNRGDQMAANGAEADAETSANTKPSGGPANG